MSNSEKKVVLVVEDDEALRNIWVDRLSIGNYDVLQAEDGEKAIELIVANEPRLVLLDLMLPKMDGYGVLEAIRKHSNPNVAGAYVIIFSNLWSDKDILRAKALKVDDYYVKANTDLEEVLVKIKASLSRS